MAEEPQPTDIQEGATLQPPLHAEDRKTAAALSSLETQNDDDESSGAATKAVDTEALGKAMKSLDVKDKQPSAAAGAKEAMAAKSKIKIDAADVGLLVGPRGPLAFWGGFFYIEFWWWRVSYAVIREFP
jgi:hypothetical protein